MGGDFFFFFFFLLRALNFFLQVSFFFSFAFSQFPPISRLSLSLSLTNLTILTLLSRPAPPDRSPSRSRTAALAVQRLLTAHRDTRTRTGTPADFREQLRWSLPHVVAAKVDKELASPPPIRRLLLLVRQRCGVPYRGSGSSQRRCPYVFLSFPCHVALCNT